MYANINQSNIPVNSTCGGNILVPNSGNTSMYCSGGIAIDESLDANIIIYSKKETIDEGQGNYHLTPIESTNEVESYGTYFI